MIKHSQGWQWQLTTLETNPDCLYGIDISVDTANGFSIFFLLYLAQNHFLAYFLSLG